MRDLRNSLYSHLQHMSLKFFTSTRTGEIQSRLSNDVGGVQAVLTDTASSILSNMATVVSTVIVMFYLSWELTVLSLGILPIFLWISRKVGRVRRDISGQTQESLADLNARLAARGAAPVGMERFRPNVVVAGAPPYAEDGWRALEANGVALALVKPCARCVITTVDPARGAAAGPEPLRTLAEYRRQGAKVLFAQNAVVRAGGTLREGDPVRATASGA